jgi:hypothetical protein
MQPGEELYILRGIRETRTFWLDRQSGIDDEIGGYGRTG